MTVIQFPTKRKIELTKEQEERIDEFAKGYVVLLNEICADLYTEDYTDEEAGELLNLVVEGLLKSFLKAIEEQMET